MTNVSKIQDPYIPRTEISLVIWTKGNLYVLPAVNDPSCKGLILTLSGRHLCVKDVNSGEQTQHCSAPRATVLGKVLSGVPGAP